MCGIVGYWALEGNEIAHENFLRFLNSLAHRGPDGLGIEGFPDDRLWLGHRRLSIIDLSKRAQQPMSYADGRYWLTFNGEIYNYLELRDALQQHGYSFSSDSDSEVILAAYAAWGPQCQLRFNGMWAFAIWDDVEKRLFLSRDRFGVKPLLYATLGGAFSFASELKAFLQLEACPSPLDERLTAETLQNICGLESTSFTLLPGVSRLPAGHCLTVDRQGHHMVQWWETFAHVPECPSDLSEQVMHFRDLLLESCRIRLRSDVPVATSLSGGLDSSAIACAIAELARRGTVDHVPDDWQRAFVACFPGTTLDERQYAEEVVHYTGMRPSYREIDAATAATELEDIIYDLEEIFTVPLVGAWAIYREMRNNGIRVSLDGHGADELLGGYHYFVDRLLTRQPLSLARYRDLRDVRSGLSGGTNIGVSGALLNRQGWTDDLKFGARYALGRLGLLEAMRPARTGSVNPFVNPALAPSERANRSVVALDDDDAPGHSPLARQQYVWFHKGLLPTFLRCIDRASMAHGIEVRSPFMDWRLVTYAFSLPDESKIGGGYTKRILRLAMQGLMPDSIRLRTRKIHFSTPIAEWSKGPLKPWFLDLTASRSFLEASAWDGPAAREAVQRAVTGDGDINDVWPVVNAFVLQQRFKEAAYAA